MRAAEDNDSRNRITIRRRSARSLSVLHIDRLCCSTGKLGAYGFGNSPRRQSDLHYGNGIFARYGYLHECHIQRGIPADRTISAANPRVAATQRWKFYATFACASSYSLGFVVIMHGTEPSRGIEMQSSGLLRLLALSIHGRSGEVVTARWEARRNDVTGGCAISSMVQGFKLYLIG